MAVKVLFCYCYYHFKGSTPSKNVIKSEVSSQGVKAVSIGTCNAVRLEHELLSNHTKIPVQILIHAKPHKSSKAMEVRDMLLMA